MKKILGRLLCFCLLANIFLYSAGIPVNAATKTLSKTDKKTYLFVSSSGEAVSATVHVSLSQNYTKQKNSTIYSDRTGFVAMSYVATYTIPTLKATDPKYVDSAGNTVKNIYGWKKISQSLQSGGIMHVAFSKKNTSKFTYGKSYSNYYSISYTVGHYEYMITPYKTKSVKKSLKV